MDAYIFQAALLCTDCANDIKRQTPPPHGVDPADPDECLYDSDDWPKGPYGEGGGEADCPQHCDSCGLFLDNPLTQDGSIYVKGAWRSFVEDGRGDLETLWDWREAYPAEWAEFVQDMDEQVERNDQTDLAVRRFRDLVG